MFMPTMNNIPKIAEKEIKERVGVKSFAKGRRYFEDDAIYEARRTETTLKATCEGSYDNEYRLWIKFNTTGISEAECSCPVGGGGFCKHIAALLLTWNAHPEQFTEVPDADKILNKLEKNELIDLIKRMLRFDPQLELMLQVQQKDDSDSKMYERQADAMFRRNKTGWRGEMAVASELSAVKYAADDFIKKKKYAPAVAVYEGLSNSIMKNLYMFPEEENISPVINECVEGLRECLKHEGNENSRLKILKTIFTIFRKDLDKFGGIGISDDVPTIIEKYTTNEEKKIVIEWIREAIAAIKGDHHDWSRREYSNLLDKLEKTLQKHKAEK